jgi:hypothetical protein
MEYQHPAWAYQYVEDIFKAHNKLSKGVEFECIMSIAIGFYNFYKG